MPDLESIISAQVEAAGGGESVESPDVDTSTDTSDTDTDTSTTDTGEVTEEVADPVTPDPADTSKEGEAVKEADKGAVAEVDPATGKPKVEEKPVEKSQLDKDLEELGLKEPKVGERENRLPFSRVKKITENYGKKVAARFEGEVATLKTENASLKGISETVKNVDRLIATDADRYITMLAGIHPEYRKFLNGGKVEEKAGKTTEVAKPASALGPRPAADHKFEDGSMGYTPDQHDKLLEWVAAKAKEDALTEARAEMDKRFKPLDDQRQSQEDYNKRVEGVKAEATLIRDMYGADVVKQYEPQIVAHMKANPTMSARQAAREIIMPALQADRNKMRTELLTETSQRPKAAAKTPAAGSVAVKEDENGPKSIESVIAGSIAHLKR